MSNIENFSGVWTELVTPFEESGKIDFDSFDNLIDMQISANVKGISFLGITGEAPTLTKTEKIQIVKRGIKKIGGRCLIMVSIGTNSTNQTIKLMSDFEEIHGIDAYSVVVPYYNKPTQEGIYKHFEAISETTSKRIFVYNNPARTGINMETETLIRLSRSRYNIIGVKESSGDIEQIQNIVSNKKDDFVVLSGYDYMTLDTIKAGGHGIISVVSNIFPNITVEMVEKSLNNEYEYAEKINNDLKEFFEGEFIQTNPLPIKFALSEVGLIQEKYRLPLCEMDSELKSKWVKILHKYIELS